MAVLHRASLTPSKAELVGAWLAERPWAQGLGDLSVLGSYRFDDPDGEVGIEALLLTDGERVLHVPVTYRAAPLEGAEANLLGTMEHGVLGTRYAYDACADPVAVRALVAAVLTGGEQARMVVEEDGEVVEERVPTVLAKGSGTLRADDLPDVGTVEIVGDDADVLVRAGDVELLVRRVLGESVVGAQDTLLVSWPEGQAVVAGVRPVRA